MKKIEEEQLNELIEILQGSCMELETACNKLGFKESDLTDEQIYLIEEQYLKCPNCGWWVESFTVDEEYCDECKE